MVLVFNARGKQQGKCDELQLPDFVPFGTAHVDDDDDQ